MQTKNFNTSNYKDKIGLLSLKSSDVPDSLSGRILPFLSDIRPDLDMKKDPDQTGS